LLCGSFTVTSYTCNRESGELGDVGCGSNRHRLFRGGALGRNSGQNKDVAQIRLVKKDVIVI